MTKHIFFENQQLSTLLIGDVTQDQVFVASAEQRCHALHVSILPSEMCAMVLKYKIDLIFGTLSFCGVSYLEVLREIKILNPKIEIVLFLNTTDTHLLYEALALKCSRYLQMAEAQKNLLKHFEDALDVMGYKDILSKNRQYFNVLIQSSVVSLSNPQGDITYINDNFTTVTGYTQEEILGKNHRILKHPSNPKEIFEDLWATITQGKVWRDRMLNKNKDGSEFWADTIIIPFKDEKTGEIIQYLSIRHDITQMLEERRAIHAREIQAREQAKLSEAKDAFLILFTHELKTPLNAIINFSQYLYKNMHRMEEIPKVKQLHLLEQIYKSATSMLEHVTHILDLSRLRNHKINYTYTFFNLKESIQDVIAKHEALALENKKKVVFCDDGSEPYISSDEFRFKQIIANILSNAIKYSTSIAKIFLVCDREKIQIIVEDDGKGVSNKESVFELYAQDGGGITTMEKKGTGIGLNFVKLLCNDLGFSCVIEDSSSLGGAKFILVKKLKD